MERMFSIKDRKALVVGGGGGLGLPISQALMENGADVAVADLDLRRTKELREQSRQNGRTFLGVRVDLLDASSIEDMVKTVTAQFQHIDILVNAAGINILKKAEDYDAAAWDKVLNINLRGTHLVTRGVGKRMIEQKYGRIINLSSVRSLLAMPQDYAAYCASKGAINMYTKQIACEWAQYGITSNAIAPTFVRTQINSFQLDDPVFYEKLIGRIPLRRICTARDVCGAVVYLASDAASFVTGQVLVLDGGLTAVQ